MARRQGWTDEQIQGLAGFEQRDDFDPRLKVALRLAERMTRDSNAVDDELWAQVRQHYDEGETVELVMAIALFNYFNIFNNALRMEPTK